MVTNPNPFTRMLSSSKFWTFILASGSTLIIYFATKYLQPTYVEDVKMVLGFVMGLAAILIGSIAWEDVAAKQNPSVVQTTTVGTNPDTSRVTTVESKPDITTTKVVSDAVVPANVTAPH